MDDLSDAASEHSTQTRSATKRQKPSTNKGKRPQRSTSLTMKQRTKNLKPSPRSITKKKHMAYTKEIIECTWSDETEYGVAFRGMTEVEQQAEVERLNKGVEKGMKSVIKTKVLEDNYTKIVHAELRAHLMDSRSSQLNMFHTALATQQCIINDLNFISVGEWVEVDADRTPGFNSEGGIAVIINVNDSLADVK